ncbi:MAG: hypothetical protein R3F14_18025 [Polyangiaceae bacterium]
MSSPHRLSQLAALALLATSATARADTVWLGDGEDAWSERAAGGVRGLTVGPIESLRHPGKGYGSEAYGRALDEAVQMGATWISLTPFGRIYDLRSTQVTLDFEAPFEENRANIARAVEMAHARGLRVLLIPHLWVESEQWRAELDPGTDEGWAEWSASYERFLLTWAHVAEQTGVEMLSVGVELRSWVTTERAASFFPILEAVRGVYHGLLTYSANWDDVGETMILQHLDLIGVNAFYPLAREKGAPLSELMRGATEKADELERLAREQHKPILLTEIGYKSVVSPAVEPWIWPEKVDKVVLSQKDQADATFALVSAMLDRTWFAGFFVWRVFADPDDVSQEPEFGFSPRGKLAERVIRDAFTALWVSDGPSFRFTPLGRHASTNEGVFFGGSPWTVR